MLDCLLNGLFGLLLELLLLPDDELLANHGQDLEQDHECIDIAILQAAILLDI